MKFIKLLIVPLAFLAVGIVRLLARFGILIRFGQFYSERIGHLAGNTECYLLEKKEGKVKAFDIWTHRGKVCNEQLALMIRRRMWVDPTRFCNLVMLVNSLFRGWEKHRAVSFQMDRDVFNLYEKHAPQLSFTAEEMDLGERTLESWGMPIGAKWVCLMVRDGAYLPELSYHSYRDSDIDSYVLAALELERRGYYVFRMGAKVEKMMNVSRIPTDGWEARIIDYARIPSMRSDFMDLYLAAHCEFAISTGMGLDAICHSFRRPVCYVNQVPVEYLFTFANSLAIWKHHVKDGKRMSFAEIVESGAGHFMKAEDFERAGITLENNSPEEIRDAVLEMDYIARGNIWVGRQEKFWSKFPRSNDHYTNRPLHGQIRMRIGSKFLEQYGDNER